MNLENKTIPIIGLGCVGLSISLELGRVRHVVGFDINMQRIDELKCGKDHTLDCSPDELARKPHQYHE
jgi:UDP-N-acetyl-D-galactosamine dehydrogenase